MAYAHTALTRRAADAFNVWGERYGTRDVPFNIKKPGERWHGRDLPLQSQAIIEAFAELRARAVNGKPDAHILIEPNATEPISYVVVVPRAKDDVIHAKSVDVPVKTGDSRKISVAVENTRNGGLSLVQASNSGVSEDDLDTHFALNP